MADRTSKLPENVPGRYYVDDTCIDCDLCRQIAPDLFTRNALDCYSYISRQPVTEDELSRCLAAMEGCPVDAVGDDGED